MDDLEVLNFIKRVLLEFLELPLPVLVEVLKVLFADLDILLHLRGLYVGSEFVLILDDVCLEQADFLHKVLIQLVFMDFAALLSKQLHLLFGDAED